MAVLIPSLTDFSFYVDRYEEQVISISSTNNPNGVISRDDSGNYLRSVITNGRRNIYECSNLSNNIILFDNANFVYIDSVFTSSDIEYRFLMKQLNNLSYKINADRVSPDSVNGFILNLNLVGREIFKIFVNGNEVLNYTSDDNSITITGSDTDFITSTEDFIKIYTYSTSQVVSGTTTFKFKGVNNLIPSLSTLEDSTFFSDKISICDKFDDNFSISFSKSFSAQDRTFEYVIEKDETNREMKINITQFGDDLQEQLRNKNFRVLAWNGSKLYIFNNCFWNDGENKTFQKTKNETTLSFDLEEVLLLEYGDGIVYGSGIYGAGYYDGYKSVNLTDVI